MSISDNWVLRFSNSKSKSILFPLIKLVLLVPFFLVGLVHNFIPYIFVKKFVENRFKRMVFWSGVKILFGAAIFSLYNIPAIFLFHNYVYDSYWLGLAYYLTVPAITGIIAHYYYKNVVGVFRLLKVSKKELSEFAKRRQNLVNIILTKEL